MKKTEKSNTNEIIEIPAEEAPYALPDGWKWVKLNRISKIKRGASPRPINQYLTDSKEGINWIKIGDTGDGKYVEQVKERITQEGKSKSVFVEKGALLLSNSMSFGRPYILKVDGCIHDGWLSITPFELVDKEFLYYALLASRWYFEQVAVGTAVRNLNSERVAGTPIPLPPLETQKRIVDRIESLFAKLDEAKEKAQTALDTFELRKSAILHKAFTGELTAGWRSSCRASDTSSASAHIESAPADISSSAPAEHIDNTSSDPVEHLNSVSSVPIEDSNNIVSVSIKDSNNIVSVPIKDPNNELSVPSSPSPKQAESTVFPKSWKEVEANDLFEYVTSGSRGWAQYYSDNGSVFVRMSNLNHNTIELDFSDIQYVDLPEKVEGLRSKIQDGDILISITADVGMIGLVKNIDFDGYINQHIALVRLKDKSMSEFIAWLLVSDVGLKQFQKKQKGATKVGLGLNDIRSLRIALPPLPEQQEIVRILDDLLAKENAAKEAAEAVVEKIDLMKKSILARAFRGEL